MGSLPFILNVHYTGSASRVPIHQKHYLHTSMTKCCFIIRHEDILIIFEIIVKHNAVKGLCFIIKYVTMSIKLIFQSTVKE